MSYRCKTKLATTPSTLTPTYETSPQVSRKNSLVNRSSPMLESDAHHPHHHHQQQQPREPVIRFQLESEISHQQPKNELIKLEGAEIMASATSSGQSTEHMICENKTTGEGANQLGRLYFKVRYSYDEQLLLSTISYN